jgi:hypothetical protein
MKLFILKRFSETPQYDVNNGFVVRSMGEDEARGYAAKEYGDEGSDTWMNASRSSCIELTADGEAGVVLRDFNAG